MAYSINAGLLLTYKLWLGAFKARLVGFEPDATRGEAFNILASCKIAASNLNNFDLKYRCFIVSLKNNCDF